jgi:hypothetical protein
MSYHVLPKLGIVIFQGGVISKKGNIDFYR